MSRDGGIFSALKEGLNLGLFQGGQPAPSAPTAGAAPQTRVPITQQPGFASGLGRLGLTLLAAGEQGKGTGEGLLLGLNAFEGALQKEREQQQLKALVGQEARSRELSDLLKLSQIAQAPVAAQREKKKQALAEKKFDLDLKKFEVEAAKPTTDPADILKQGNKLRGEFTDLSKDFFKQRDAFGRIKASVSDPSAAGDLALIFNFMKVLDPGSTVREGEFANAENSASVPESLRGKYNKVVSGERLTVKTRGDFVSRSEKLFNAAGRQHDKRVNQFSALSSRQGVDPQNVVLDLGLAEEAATKEAAQVAPGGQSLIPNLPQGVTFLGFE